MSSSLNWTKTGMVVGKGADKKIVLGFKPRVVKVINVTDLIVSEKYDTMPSAKAFSAKAGALAIYEPSYADHIVLEADGFTIKAALAVSAKELHYFASEGKNE